jgi:hypothetical protein
METIAAALDLLARLFIIKSHFYGWPCSPKRQSGPFWSTNVFLSIQSPAYHE